MGVSARAPSKKPIEWSWRSRVVRGWVYQLLALGVVIATVWFLAHNTQENMRTRGIQSGFDFLGSAAGFDIGETTFVAYDPSESYGKALWVGVLNTLRVAVIGIVLTTILGVLVGVGRFSRNALVRGLCYVYVEVFRNVPILLQLLMWYLLFVDVLPPTPVAELASVLPVADVPPPLVSVSSELQAEASALAPRTLRKTRRWFTINSPKARFCSPCDLQKRSPRLARMPRFGRVHSTS